MARRLDEEQEYINNLLSTVAANEFAKEMDDILLDIAELNPEVCPPDRRIYKGDREAWIYEHGNIAELVFVKTEQE